MRIAILLSLAVAMAASCGPKIHTTASGTCVAGWSGNDCPACWAPWVPDVLEAGEIDPASIRCNSQSHYGRYIQRDSRVAASRLVQRIRKSLPQEKVNDAEFREVVADGIRWWMVRSVLLEGENNNFGAMVLKDHFWTDEHGVEHPVVIFRLAYTPEPTDADSCFRSVLVGGNVKHVVNLYDGSMPVSDLDKAEATVAAEVGVKYVRMAELDYGAWRHALEDNSEKGAVREAAFKALGRLIKEQILLPGGQPPKGNILIHCGGGMHRSGMVSGILQRHVNKESMEDVARVYRFHVGWADDAHPGGFEEDNLEVIEHFDPAYLD